MSIKPILNNPNALNNKTLNLFSNEIQVNNINTPDLNGIPVSVGFVQNPLNNNLKLNGFAIIEELSSLSPSLNIEQLNNTKDIKLKISGISKVDVKDNEIKLNENLNMDNNSIENINDINNNLIQFNSVGNSIKLNSNPTENISINADGDLIMNSNAVSDIKGVLVRTIAEGVVQSQSNLTGTEFLNNISLTNNDIINVSKIDGNNGYLDFNSTAGIPPFTINAMELKTNPGGRLNIQSDNEVINIIGNSIVHKADLHQFETSGGTGLISVNNLAASFQKNIDMLNNDIINVSDLRGIGTNNHINLNPNNQMDLTSGIISLNTTSSIIHNTSSAHVFRISVSDRLIISSSSSVIKNSNLDLDNNNINKVGKINGLSVNGGLFVGTSNSNQLTTSTTEQSIFPLTLLGSKSVPSNGFKVGDSYRLKLTGNFSSNNGDNLIIRLKGGVSSAITLATETIALNSSTNVFFNIDIDFNIRAIGAAGTAELVSSFNFVYNQQSGGNYQGQLAVSIENTNFDTTIQNDLDITAEFSSASANNSIETIHGVLNKVY